MHESLSRESSRTVSLSLPLPCQRSVARMRVGEKFQPRESIPAQEAGVRCECAEWNARGSRHTSSNMAAFPLPCSPCIFPYSNVGWQMEGSEEGMHLQGGAGKGRAQGAPGCGVSVEGMRSVDVPTRSRTGRCIGRNRSARAICRQYCRARVGNASTYFTPSRAATK